MLNRLLELLAAVDTRAQEDEHYCNDDKIRLATCVLLLEMAGADREFSPEECSRILEILKRRFELNQDEAESLMTIAQEQREDSIDVWRFTNQINHCCKPGEKIRIVEELWRVIYADGSLDAHEDYLIHKLARLLNLTNRQLIDAKIKVRDEPASNG